MLSMAWYSVSQDSSWRNEACCVVLASFGSHKWYNFSFKHLKHLTSYWNISKLWVLGAFELSQRAAKFPQKTAAQIKKLHPNHAAVLLNICEIICLQRRWGEWLCHAGALATRRIMQLPTLPESEPFVGKTLHVIDWGIIVLDLSRIPSVRHILDRVMRGRQLCPPAASIYLSSGQECQFCISQW